MTILNMCVVPVRTALNGVHMILTQITHSANKTLGRECAPTEGI